MLREIVAEGLQISGYLGCGLLYTKLRSKQLTQGIAAFLQSRIDVLLGLPQPALVVVVELTQPVLVLVPVASLFHQPECRCVEAVIGGPARGGVARTQGYAHLRGGAGLATRKDRDIELEAIERV